MSKTIPCNVLRKSSSAFILAVLLSASMLAHADTKKAPAPAKPATAARPAPVARPGAKPATGAGGTAKPQGAITNGPTTHGPTANGPRTTGPITSTKTSGMGEGVRPGSTGRPNHALQPRGIKETNFKSGDSLRRRADGRPSDFHDTGRGMDIHHGLNGNRRVMVERADHSRTVFQRGRPGYVQHPFAFRGHDFARRTYFYHGRVYSHFYHGYAYRGMYINVYAPGFYYRPAYYGWAYGPWGAPAYYQWGFAGNPWYGYYGYYFAPSPAYSSASDWLTDYMISSDLQQAYTAHVEAGEMDGAAGAAGGAPALTPEVKQQIAAEVRNQLSLENQEAQLNANQQDVDPGSSGIDRMLNDGRPHVFVVGSSLDVVDATQTECALSDGDVLTLQTPPPGNAAAANLVVLASKGGQECQKQATVTVALDDLQEMQNHMRESVDQGLQELQAKQGKDGLPAVPASAQAQPAQAQYAAIAPPEDPNAGVEVQQQAQQADQAEKDVATEDAGIGGH